MTTNDFITQLFCRVDDKLNECCKNNKHRQANLYPSEVVTLGLLFALKGKGNRAFYRWFLRNHRDLFPNLPERTRLFRLFNSHRHLIDLFMAEASLIGVIDTYGIELIHPRREGRSERQIGRKGLSNQRWIVASFACFLTTSVVDWDCDTANVYKRTEAVLCRYDGSAFQHLVDGVENQMVVFAREVRYRYTGRMRVF